MSEIKLPVFSYLIVDDVRLCRLNVLGILKNIGCKNCFCAPSGAKAKEILEEEPDLIDCVITDIDMPDMNGLQFLKAIRTGLPGVRRDLPVALLTGHGDESLVGLGLALDVNTFLLKPANRGLLVSRLEQMLYDDLTREQWIGPSEQYARIDVDAPLSELIQRNVTVQKSSLEEVAGGSSGNQSIELDKIPENAVLNRAVYTTNGRMVYDANTVLTNRHLTRLKGLRDLGFLDEQLWVLPPQPQENKPDASKSATLQDEEADVSTLARYGKLNFGQKADCMRCSNSFSPDHEMIRQHNRRDLTDLFCPGCLRRDNELLCATVKLMIAKGGFPIAIDQVENAFSTPDKVFQSNKEDPFESLREEYKNDPLTESDIMRWINNNFLSFNKSSKKVECLIDRVLKDPERVILLGKEGILAKKIANQRTKIKVVGFKRDE